MEAKDIIFYGLIVLSGVASIVKSVKKKGSKPPGGELPDFKGESPAKWLQTILEDKEEEDDFIPVNPKPVVQNSAETVLKTASKETTYSYEGKTSEGKYNQEAKSLEGNSYETRVSPETFRRSNQSLEKTIMVEGRINQGMERAVVAKKKEVEADIYKTSLNSSLLEGSKFESVINDDDLLSPTDDLKNLDEMKRAIIYGEIMRTKF